MKVFRVGRSRVSTGAVIGVGLLSLVHADQRPLGAQSALRQDSAGVEVVTNDGPRWSAGAGWRLDAEPKAVAGEDGQLWQVRAVALAPDGSIAVLTLGTRSVHLFDDRGSFRSELGRPGSGPGELERPVDIAFRGADTVQVFDRRHIESFSTDGSFLGATVLDERGLPGGVQAMVLGRDGSLVLVRPGVPSIQGTEPFRVPESLVISPPDSEEPVMRDGYAGILQQRVQLPGGGRTTVVSPFAPRTVYGAIGTSSAGYFAADGARREVHVFGADGALRRIVRWSAPDRRVTDELVESWKAQQRLSPTYTGTGERLEAAWQRVDVPDVLPAFDDVFFDSTGGMWIRHVVVAPGTPARFSVFDETGLYLGDLEAPAGLQVGLPIRITEDSFAGVWVDRWGVETVRVYGVDRTR